MPQSRWTARSEPAGQSPTIFSPTKRHATCVASALLNEIPACALNCIEQFVECNYEGSTCTEQSDLKYLCTHTNVSGLTVGEGAFQCIVSNCVGTEQTNIGAYNICANMSDAIPETVGTITATIRATSSAMPSSMASVTPTTTSMVVTTSLPASIPVPTSTEQISTIVMASGTPSSPVSSVIPTPIDPTIRPSSIISATSLLRTPSSTFATVTSSAAATPTGTGNAVASSSEMTMKGGLTTGHIVGIAVAGVASAVLAFGFLLFFFCLRKKRRVRRRSARFSVVGTPAPPSNPGYPQNISEKPTHPANARLGNYDPSLRFYAPPAEQKRRSFWRKSIKPEDIGVAVSPRVVEGASPASFSSQHSSSKLLPSLPRKALFPEPLRFGTGGDRLLRLVGRPTSDATIFDEDPPARATNDLARPAEVIAQAYREAPSAEAVLTTRKQRSAPPPLDLSAATRQDSVSPGTRPCMPSRTRTLPLTPVYDNGNFIPGLLQNYVPPIRGMNTKQTTNLSMTTTTIPPQQSPPPYAVMGHKPPDKTRTAQLPTRSSVYTNHAQSKSAFKPVRHTSVISSGTDFEEDSTPEQETGKTLESGQANAVSPTIASSILDPISPSSPIRNLQYPRIPRPASVSKQAEKVAVPRAAQMVETSGPTRPVGPITPPRSHRDGLVRAGRSFIRTDTTSSVGSISGNSLKFPSPPQGMGAAVQAAEINRRALKDNSNLRPYTTNLGRKPSVNIQSTTMPKSILKRPQAKAPPSPPPSQIRMTPTKSRTGDLYLTVDI